MLPWYAAWGLPLLALSARSFRPFPALVYAALLHLAYIPDYTQSTFFPSANAAVVVAQQVLRTAVIPAVAVVVIGYACTILLRSRQWRPSMEKLPGSGRNARKFA